MLVELWAFEQPGLDLFLEPIGVTFDINSRRMMQYPVEDRCGDYGISEYFIPLVEAAVGG